jgi:hypothetical protein
MFFWNSEALKTSNVFVLVALCVGQRQYGNVGWSNLLGAYAVGAAGIVGARNYLK